MGQVCAKRKRKLSDDVSGQDTVSAISQPTSADLTVPEEDTTRDELGPERFEMYTEYRQCMP